MQRKTGSKSTVINGVGNKKLEKERQEAIRWVLWKITRSLNHSIESLWKTQKRRSKSDDDFDVTSLKEKKSSSLGTDTIAYLEDKREKIFRIKNRGVEAQIRAVTYGKAKARSFKKPRGNAYAIIWAANEYNVGVSWRNF